MINPFWRPSGRSITPTELKDGQYVEGYLGLSNQNYMRRLRDGRIRLHQDTIRLPINRSGGTGALFDQWAYVTFAELQSHEYRKSELVDVFLQVNGREYRLGYKTENTWHGDFGYKYRLYTGDRFKTFKKGAFMANKLLSTLRLNKAQRHLAKVGVYDENGNLTDDGKELLLNQLAQKHETELVDLTKDLAKEKKEKS